MTRVQLTDEQWEFIGPSSLPVGEYGPAVVMHLAEGAAPGDGEIYG